MTKHIDTVIVGGGQAGLSTSYHLTRQGREHIILEKANQPAQVWRSRWDSFTLITPNWTTQLPGAEYVGDNPDAFMGRDDLVNYFEDYIEQFEMPVQFGMQVNSVESNGNGYHVRTNNGTFKADNVVIAAGMHQEPKRPHFSANMPASVHQLHSHEYRNPNTLPEGAVLVVGSAQSGCQIAEELYQDGRKVYLSVSSAGRIPRRYRGKDITRWMEDIGFGDRTVDQLPSPKAKFGPNPHGTGKDGGHTINLHQFVRDGVVLLGRIQDVQREKFVIAPNLKENLAASDKFEVEMIKHVDEFIDKNGLDEPVEILPNLRDGYEVEEILELDLISSGIRSIVWATGFKFDFSWVELPAFDEDGFPVQTRGVTDYPGLYFVGLPFLHNAKSGLLSGVGEDAAHVADHIEARDQA